MCIYALKVFACSHGQWGARQMTCIIGREFQEGRLPEDCVYMAPHALKTTMSSHMCSECGGSPEEVAPTSKPSSPNPVRNREAATERQMKVAAREERERRFQEEKVKLEDIKRLKNNIVACYDKGPAVVDRADSSIYSENGEIKTSPRHESFGKDANDELDSTSTETDIGLGIFCPQNHPIVNHSSARSDGSSQEGPYTTSPGLAASPESLCKQVTPKKAPESRRAIPAFRSKLPQPRATVKPTSLPKKSIKKPETPPVNIPKAAPKTIKRPQTPPAMNAKIPRSAPKSRLAVPSSKTPPRYIPTASTPSKLPKPGSAVRKLRDSGCSFGLSE